MLNLYKLPSFTFPEGFLWGSATAGHQIEGDNIHCQRWKQELELNHPDYVPSGKACNSWELYKEDIELLKELKHQAYRFSIEWSRIEPEKGVHDEKALEQYLDQLRRLKEAGIHTNVTLWHFTHPLWFEELGGFAKEENLEYFRRHLEYLVPRIAPLTDSWIVMNEINLGAFHPQCFVTKKIKLKAHAYGAEIIRAHSKAPVSTAHAYVPRVPLRPDDEMDITAARMQEWNHNTFFFHGIRTGEIVLPGMDMEYMPQLKNSCDYWAVNYYHRGLVDSRKADLMGKKFNFNNFQMIPEKPMTREFCPETFVHAMGRISDKPVWITENGVPALDDQFRVIYIMLQLEAMKEAMALYHTDIKAYFHWSLLDNYEWGSYHPRFGLVAVDRETFKRTPKPSAYFLREIIERNGMSGELFAKYVPELPQYTLLDYEKPAAVLPVETQA